MEDDSIKRPPRSEHIIQRGRKSASNSEPSKPFLQSGISRSSLTPLRRGIEPITKPSSGQTGSGRSASFGRAVKSTSARTEPERSGSEKDIQIIDVPRHGQIKKSKATKIGYSGSASTNKSITTPAAFREGAPQTTPSRVRFVQQKSSTVPRSSLSSKSTNVFSISPLSLPARKSGSAFPFRKQQLPTAVVPTMPFKVKTSQPLPPLWQQLDDEYERVSRRTRIELGGFARRISSTGKRGISAREAKLVQHTQASDRVKSRIAPKLRFQRGNESPVSSEEERIPAKVPGTRTKPQLATKKFATKKSAARKVEYIDATSSEESPETSDVDSPMDSQEDQLLPEEYEPPPLDEIEIWQKSTVSSKFIPAPRITIPLPQVKAELEDPIIGEPDPPDLLLNAVEALTLSPIRMQATKQLPFLRRNLRKGFLKRCMDLLVPIYKDDKEISLLVKYDYVDGIVFRGEVDGWICPICNLLGRFPTREMLNCHLEWDHREVFSEWEKVEETDVRRSWKLQILVPETSHDNVHNRTSVSQDNPEMEPEEQQQQEKSATPVQRDHLSETPDTTSIFPFVSTSPPDAVLSPVPADTTSPSSTPSRPKPEESRLNEFRPPISPSIQRSESQPSFSSRGRSTTGTSLVTTTTATTTPGPRPRQDERYPTPPPPDDPLGPSARPPYLPAHSDHGGPSVLYSCRPGGPCLFDHLGTLPTKEFGILDWQVLDCEEEIYESDDVKEEYKVMHALWARWIMLHRQRFISNYLQGAIAFVDQYWRIIHKAAGWDALRYWLLILAFNQFLTGHEVAQVLLHYENLTGTAP